MTIAILTADVHFEIDVSIIIPCDHDHNIIVNIHDLNVTFVLHPKLLICSMCVYFYLSRPNEQTHYYKTYFEVKIRNVWSLTILRY